MKKLYLLLALASLSFNALAASEAACASWLCAPMGYAPGACADARAEMIKRAFSGKPILPPLSSCGVDSSAGAVEGMPIVTVHYPAAQFTGRCLAPRPFFFDLSSDPQPVPGCDEWEVSKDLPEWNCWKSADAQEIVISDANGEQIEDSYMFSIHAPKHNGRCGG